MKKLLQFEGEPTILVQHHMVPRGDHADAPDQMELSSEFVEVLSVIVLFARSSVFPAEMSVTVFPGFVFLSMLEL